MSYAFLNQSPPQKKRPSHLPPCIPVSIPIVHRSVTTSTRRRSATVSAISAWAAQIVPGSPPPLTPRSSCSPYCPRTPLSPRSPTSVHHRRRSCSTALHSPTNFLNLIDTPSTANLRTPSERDLDKRQATLGFDLLAQGYTTAIVQLPTLSPLAPLTAPATRTSTSLSLDEPKPLVPPIPISPVRKNSQTRLRSLSFKSAKKAAAAMLAHAKPTSASTSGHHSSSHKSSSKGHSSSKSSKHSTPAERYAHLIAPGGGAGAMSLNAEVQLSQMLDGGSLDANIKRVTHRHAKDTGAIKRSRSREPPVGRKEDRVGGGVSGIYQDEKGRMWWDEDEALELTGLLPNAPSTISSPAVLPPPPPPKRSILPRKSKESRSMKENAQTSATAPRDWVEMDATTEIDNEDPARRGSASAMSDTSRDSDLDPYRAVRPREGSAVFVPGYKMSSSGAGSIGMHDAFAVSPLDSSRTGSTDAAPRSKPRPRHRPTPLALNPPELPEQVSQRTSRRTESSRSHKHSRTATSTTTMAPLLPTQAQAPLATEGKRDFFAASFTPAIAMPPHSHHGQHVTPSATGMPMLGKENAASSSSADAKSSRRGSVTFVRGFNALANSVKSARRASTSTASLSPTTNFGNYPNPSALQGIRSGSAVHLPLPKPTSRVQTHATGPASHPVTDNADSASGHSGKRTLRSKSSKLDVRALFRSRS